MYTITKKILRVIRNGYTSGEHRGTKKSERANPTVHMKTVTLLPKISYVYPSTKTARAYTGIE
jgi:hypothetical protein